MSWKPNSDPEAVSVRRLLTVSALLATALLLAAATFEGQGPRPPVPQLEDIQPVPVHEVAGTAARVTTAGPSPVSVPSLPEPDDCFVCHDDDTMTMERDGREISLYVSPDDYASSQHGNVDCIECHAGYDPDEEPHTENPQPVDCAGCHAGSARSFRAGGHRSELSCSSCHSNVHTRPGLRSTEATCTSCHEEAVAEVAGSLHDDDEFGPGCIDCHGSHRVARANSATCLTCHGEREFVHEHIEGEDVEAVLEYADSIHGDNIECSDCHAGHAVVSTDDPRSPVSHQNVATTCAQCHDDVAEEYMASEHGKALSSGFEGAPTCTDCHGEHDIHQITDSESPVSRQHEVEICESCHLNTDNVAARMTHTTGFVASYDNSVHGLAAAGGDAEAAICSDCHGGHQAMKASSPNSRTNHFNISATCGQCHGEIEETFA
ncbi:MAG: cytochrome c3 family protein, partial [Rhodothermales bacterium]|nr:cytochrome c3 family protein [Rhodothermales bacterium]